MGGASLLFTLTAGACALIGESEVTLSERAIRIRDVATLHCLDESVRDRVGALIIARTPIGARAVQISRDGLASLVRRRAPALARIDARSESNEIVFYAPDTPTNAQTRCFRTLRTLGEGQVITGADVEPAPCDDDAAAAAMRYDRVHSVLRTHAPVAAGAYLGAAFTQSAPVTSEGAAMTLVVTAGPVQIERRVEAVQPARAGERIFVRDEDGAVFAVAFPDPSAAP
ncbi:MAG: hypothetical protein H7124_05480 [Phycisphaerales bacterium]|nr:hypothetical protein [Hyphomonadaceae bacterium]